MEKENEDMENNDKHFLVRVVFEDENILVVNKPPLLTVHGDGRTKEFTLADWILQYHPNLINVGEQWVSQGGETIPRPGIVHRLDKETSGIMIIAKTQNSYDFLKTQFKERSVKKIYHAFIYGVPKLNSGTINKAIGKSKSDFRKWSAQPGSRGTKRDAITHWKVLANVQGESLDTSLLELRPKTGRTHQLRVHLKAIHHPIVCDKLYAPKKECVLGFSRLALHSREIEIPLPGSHKERTFVAEYPKDFENALQYAKLLTQ